MASAPKRQIGTMACMCCGHEIPVKAGESGTINAACPWCDFPAYAKAGTEAHRIITARLKNKPQPKPEPKPEPKAPEPAAPPPTPARRPARSIFDLGARNG